MTKDVLVSISGAHTLNGESDDVSVITAGSYYYKNGKHYIIYDEVVDGVEGSAGFCEQPANIASTIRAASIRASAFFILTTPFFFFQAGFGLLPDLNFLDWVGGNDISLRSSPEVKTAVGPLRGGLFGENAHVLHAFMPDAHADLFQLLQVAFELCKLVERRV